MAQSIPPENDEAVSIPAEKAYYLQRTQVVTEVQGEILDWAKKRFWAISIVVLTVGALGGGSLLTAIIEIRVNSRISEEVQRNQTKLDELREAAAIARNATDKATKAADLAEEKLAKFDEKTTDLERRANTLAKDLSEISTSGLKVSENLRLELQRLSDVVRRLAEKQSESDERAVELVASIDSIQSELSASGKAITEQKERADLAQYSIQLRGIDGYEAIENALREKGFSVNVSPTEDTLQERSSIGLSHELPIEIVRELVETIRETWPSMRRLYASDIDDGTTTLIGGVNRIVSNFGYRELTDEEIAAFLREAKSTEELLEMLKASGSE